ncbi:EAL domain-containing protein [Bacillus sp. N9]
MQVLAGERITFVKVTVNISVVQLRQRDKFLTAVTTILNETGLDPQWLVFEITETILIETEDSAIFTLKQLSDIGINIAIDDFGTGYTSMSHMKSFSVNTIKIDRAFISDLHLDNTSVAIVKSIITLAEHLQLNTIAEGVENQEQLQAVFNEKCKEVQGYYYSPSVLPKQMERFLIESKTMSFNPIVRADEV